MSTSRAAGSQRSGRQRLVDLGMPLSLLVAIFIVWLVDRSQSVAVDNDEPLSATAVELVFVLDQRDDMRDLAEAIKANCLEKAEGLQATGLKCRFAVVTFGRDTPLFPTVPLTSELENFRKQFSEEPAEGDDAGAKSSVEALKDILDMDFRDDVPVLVFVISKSPFEKNAKLTDIAKQLAKKGVTTNFQADSSAKELCRPFYENGGRFYSMDGDDLTPKIVAKTSTGKKDASRAQAANLLSRITPKPKAGNKKQDTSQLVKMKGIFALRTAPRRERMIADLGGTPESERAVADGLDWLARHQAYDGHWCAHDKCEADHPCRMLDYQAPAGRPVAETGMAILAFQAGGNYYFNNQKYSDNVRRGLDWLVAQQGKDGRLFGVQKANGHSGWYTHGIATFALADACATAKASREAIDPRYLAATKRAVEFMERHQYARGGWRYTLTSRQTGDTSVTGWQILALKSAIEAGIEVSPATMQKVLKFFEDFAVPRTGQTGYATRGRGTLLTTAVGLIVQQFITDKPNPLLIKNAAQVLRGRAAYLGQHGDFYTLYNATLAMYLTGGDAWTDWNNNVRDAVVKRQVKTGCERGSWYRKYGRTLDTAWAVLTLEVYYRYATEKEEKDK